MGGHGGRLPDRSGGRLTRGAVLRHPGPDAAQPHPSALGPPL